MTPKEQVDRFHQLAERAKRTCAACGRVGPPTEVATSTTRWWHGVALDGSYTSTLSGIMDECHAGPLYDEMQQIKVALGL